LFVAAEGFILCINHPDPNRIHHHHRSHPNPYLLPSSMLKFSPQFLMQQKSKIHQFY